MNLSFKKYPFTSPLGWSNSRFELFSRCERWYFYNYYGKYVPEIPLQRINELKNLTTIPLEIGHVIHHVMETFLKRLQKSSTPVQKERFLKYGQQTCEEFFSDKVFLETFYPPHNDIDISYAQERISTALSTFLESPLYPWIIERPQHEKDQWIIEPPGYGETRIGGKKAYCKMDFLLPVQDEFHIIDWKSGSINNIKHTKQLLGYAVALREMIPEIPIESIRPRGIYLGKEYQELDVDLNKEALDEFVRTVHAQIEELLCFCRIPEENIPLSMEHFTPISTVSHCKYCPFQELCAHFGENNVHV